MSRFTITLSGLAEADAVRFRAALNDLPPHGWRLVDTQSADLMVVDIDTVWGHMDWLRATASGQRVVIYTERDEVRDSEWLLTKPLQSEALKSLLDGVAAPGGHVRDEVTANAATPAPTAAPPDDASATAPVKPVEAAATTIPTPIHMRERRREPSTPTISSQPEPAAEPVTAGAPIATSPAPVVDPNPAAIEPAAIEPAAITSAAPVPATLGEQLLAGQIDRPLRVEGSDGIVLQLDPEHGGYYGPLTLKSLQPLLSLPADAAQSLDEEALARARMAPALPLTRLLWFAALCATPGRLSATLDPLASYRLTRWPQIEREFPRHFRIATTMMKQPGTLEQVAAAAHAPVGDVADFINAYCTAGYVAAEVPSTEAAGDTSSGVLSRLRRPVARGSQESA